MGMFTRKTQAERTEQGMRLADNMVAGKGVYGKIGKAFMGNEFTTQMAHGLDTARTAQANAAIVASGARGLPATVTSITDTGQLINGNPVVVLAATLPSGQHVTLQTPVSKIEVPRAGDTVTVIPHPAEHGAYVYGGMVRPTP